MQSWNIKTLRNSGVMFVTGILRKTNHLVFSLQIKPSTIEMKEGGVRLRLTIVDTPGFGDAVDNTDW